MRRTWWIVAVLLSGARAWADAVPPPPASCPDGGVPVTDHRGPRCEAPPPRSCPPGWRGVVGGTCVLDVCDTDQQCGAGRRCVPQSLCFEQYRCHPRVCGGESTMLFAPRRLCGAGRTCSAPDECRPGKLCLAQGVEAPGDYPPPTPGSAAQPVDSGAPAAGSAVEGSRPAGGPSSGGCAGCRGPQSAALGVSAGIGLLCATMIARKRRR